MTNTVLQGYRLSPQQARLHALGEAAPDLPLGVACALRLRGALDRDALQGAVSRVAARHEILRTTFHAVPGGDAPVQVVEDEAGAALDFRDLAGLPERERAAADAAAWGTVSARLPGGYGAPPLRAVLCRHGEGDHVLHLGLPALCADAPTLDALVAGIGAAYAERTGGPGAPDATGPVQYVNFSEWLHDTLASEQAGEGRSFWSRREASYGGALPDLWPAPAGARGAAVEHRVLGPGTARRLGEAAALRGTSEEAWLLAAWRVLLWRHVGDGGSTVGVAADGRAFDELRGSMGPFTRYLPLGGGVAGAESFAALAAASGEALRQLRAWQAFHEWPAADGKGPPRLRFGFDHAELPPRAGRWGGVACRVERRWHQTERFGLRLATERVGEGEGGEGEVRVSLYYDAAALAGEGAERLLRRYAVLLEGVLADPGARVDALPLLDREEREEALGLRSAGRASFPAEEPLHRLFERRAALAPDAVAVACGEESLTYRELDERAGRIARHLRGRGVGPEARVGLLLERGVDAVAGILGILKAGGAYVPLDPAYPAARIAQVLEDAGVRVLLTEELLRGRIPAGDTDVVALDAERERIEAEEGGALPGGAGPDSLAYVVYTSGSTGRPKGVQVTHANVVRLFAATEGWFGFGPDDVWTLFHSLAFDFSVWETWGALLHGGRLVVVPFAASRSPGDFRALLAREGVTVLSQTPSAFRQLAAADEAAGGAAPALRWVVFGGEALEPGTLRSWIGRHGAERPRLVNMYGITETTVHVTLRRIVREDVEAARRSPLGAPIADLDVHLLDPRLEPVPVGVAGEIFVGGAGVARGYLGRPELTAERFVPDPFGPVPGARLYRSGDLARRLPRGDLEFLGRADQQVKVRGFRIEPGEVEAALLALPGVREAVVVAREDEPGPRRLVAYLTAAGEAPAAAGLRERLLERLPEHMVPSAFVVLGHLPLTPNGKLDRGALPAPDPAAGAEAGYAPPRTPTEEVLAAVWAEVLGTGRLGIDDGFFAAGGDSILSVRVAALARERGLDVDVADVFAHPTVRSLAERVARGRSESVALEAILRRDRRPFDLAAEEDRAALPEDAEDAYPLSALQAGMLYHQLLDPGAPAYHNVDSFHLRGRFDEASFRTALRRAAERQENLRTSIHLAGFREPLQVVRRHAEVPLVVEDLRHLDDAAQEALLRELRETEYRTPFDLARAPLLRMRVHLRADDRFQLTLAENHAINDGWSLTSLLAELFEDHAALLRGEPLPERPRPAVRFRDFVELERDAAASEASRRFWAERLEGVVPARLPRPVGSAHAAAGAEFMEVPLAPGVREGLAGLARSLAVPLKSVLLAAHAKVLGLSTGERDVTTGLVTSGRPEVAGGSEVRGLFLNTVPLRVELGEGSWEELVRRVFRAEAELLPHRRYPGARLQHEHGPEPLFEASFNLVRFHSVAEVLRSGVVEVISGGSRADTDHLLAAGAKLHPVTSEILSFGFDYRPAAIGRGQALELADRYRRVLEAMTADPSGRHDRLAPLSDGERARVVEEWNRTEVEHPSRGCVHERVAAWAVRTPDAPALVCGEETLRYGELNGRANRLAHHLVRLGVGPETRVGICLERGPELVVCMLAVLRAGGAYVPLDPAHPAERLGLVLADSGAAVLLTREVLRGAVAAPEGVRVVSVDARAGEAAAGPAADPESRAEARSLAYVVYTSGSTGTPKGVAVEHGALANVCDWHARNLGITSSDRATQMVSPGFDAAALETWPFLARGACVQVVPDAVRADPEGFRDWLVRHGSTVATTVPAIAEPLLAMEWPRATALRWLLSGADRLRVRPAAGIPFGVTNNYGPTECTIIATSARVAGEGGGAPSIGRPVDNTRVYVLDAGMHPVPVGAPGEMYVGGAQVARGYLGRPDLTAERFVPDPFGREAGARLYRTGDRARWLPPGELEFLGRVDQQVKVRGFRVEPGEVEAVLRRQAGVAECLVAAREDAAFGVPGEARLVAYVVGGAGADELRAALRGSLPEYMVPSAFVALDRLPLTPNGKPDRKALPAPDYGAAEADHVAPRTPVEEVLAGIWAEVLRLDRVGVEESFFELGGDSILSMQVVSRARRAGVEVTPRQLFEYPTIAGLAAVAGRVGVEGRSAEPDPDADPAGPTPIQAWLFEQDQPVPEHYNQSMLLEVDAAVRGAALEAALAAVLEHHDALRLRLRRSGRGWEQWHAPGAGITLERVDLSRLPAEDQDRAQDRAAAARQASLELERGPLGRATLFDRGGRGRVLLLVLHHLVTDGVSWRILREDLDRACAQAGAGGPVELGPKGTPYREWVRALEAYAASGAPAAEADFWLAQGAEAVAPLPVEGEGERTVGASRTVSAGLDEAETRALLHEVPAAYRTRLHEVLLCALAEALSGWTGDSRVRVALEGHGREEEVRAGVDLTRTVGWFTSVYPVVLDTTGAAGPGERLGRVKEQLRAVPLRGIGYGVLRYLGRDETVRARLAAQAEPEISFNYLGRFDREISRAERIRFAAGPRGPDQAAANRRPFLLDVSAGIVGGRLQLGWTYDEGAHRRETVERLAGAHAAALRALAAHCREEGAGGCTPSDFPLAGLAQAELDPLVAGRRVEDLYPLSHMQEGILFHALYGGDSQAYQVQIAQRLEGALDEALLRRAWAEVVGRHAVLRTAFVWEGLREPLQRVESEVVVPWTVEDWTERSADEQESALEGYLERDRRRGFALGEAPLLRLALFRVGAGAHWLVWSQHHLLLDGWASARVVGEVMQLYRAWSTGGTAELKRARPYRDYVRWLRSRDLAAAERYWRGVLAGFGAPTPLGADRPAGARAGMRYARRSLALPAGRTRQLEEAARRARVTLNTVVQGAWGVLLSRYGGEEDVVFGATVSGRPAGLEGSWEMVGLFINTLPVRARVPGGARLGEWLAALQREQAEAQEHEHAALVQVQGWSEVPRGAPLFESLVVFENYPVEHGGSGGAGARLLLTETRSADWTTYPLCLTAAPGPELQLELSYDESRFEAAAVERMLDHLARLLEQAAAGMDARLAGLELLDEAERRRVLEEWNRTERAYPRGSRIHELFEASAARAPAAAAVVHGGCPLSYRELDRRANQLSHHLRRMGVGPETRVGICFERGPDLALAILGTLKAGGACVPVDPEYPAARLAWVLEDSGAAVLLTQSGVAERLPPTPASIVRLDAEAERISSGSTEAPESGAWPDPEGLAYVVYTSGSTGTPKGVALPHRALVNFAADMAGRLGLGPADRVLQFASPGFDVVVEEIFPAWAAGAAVVFPRGGLLAPGELLEVLEREAVTGFELPTAYWHEWVHQLAVAGKRLPGCVRFVLVGGERVLPERLAEWSTLGVPLVHVFGLTETACTSTTLRLEAGDDGSRWPALPVGTPTANVRVHPLDRALRPVPAGVPGELFIGGEGVARGYLDRPALTAERFVPDPFSARPGARLYRTGDRVRWLPDGTLEFLGRLDEQVKVRGFRVEPGEVERALAAHPGVREARVVARGDARGEARLVAYVTGEARADELRAHLRESLPEHMVPGAFVALERLPLTPHGKLDHRALPAPERESAREEYVAPRTPTEETMAAIWSELLGIERVGALDGFFDLGGHSLRVMRLVAELRAAFGVEVPIRSVFAAPTLEALSGEVERLVYEEILAMPEAEAEELHTLNAISGG